MTAYLRRIRQWVKRKLPYVDRNGRAFSIALVYLVAGSLWILITDSLVFRVDGQADDVERDLSALKGLLFVGLSAALVYVLTSSLYGRIMRQAGELEALINNSGDLIWSVDREMRLISYNRPYTEAIRQLSGLSIRKGAPGLMREFGDAMTSRWRNHYTRALAGETFSVLEETTFKGVTYHAEVLLSPIREGESVVGISCVARDVTKRVVVESQLHQQKVYWDMLSRHASDGIIICDAGGKLIFFNETMRRWHGEINSSLDPEDWARAFGLYTLDGSRLLRTDEVELFRALNGETFTHSRHSVKRPGQALRYVESSGGPLHDSEGRLMGAMVLIRDITDRYRREFEITDAVIEAAESERKRIAADLHDSVTQSLSIVSLNLNNYQLENPPAAESIRFLKAQAYLEKAIDETRSISQRMVPGTVRDLGLAGAVEELVEDLKESSSFALAFTCNFQDRLDPSQELDLYRLIQEALHNVIRHAQAELAAVDIHRTGDSLAISITDNGRGFKASQSKTGKVGIGLRTMRNRAAKWGGSFEIQSDQGSTTVHVVIPLKSRV